MNSYLTHLSASVSTLRIAFHHKATGTRNKSRWLHGIKHVLLSMTAALCCATYSFAAAPEENAAALASGLAEADKGLKEQLVGTWALQSYVETNMETGEKTYPMGKTPSGFIIYTADDYMSAQISAAGRERFSANDMFGGTEKEYTAAGQSYLAYSGPFEVDEQASKVTHIISISLYPNWVGMRQVRIFKLEGDILRLSFERPQLSRGAMRTADLVWIRATAQ